MEQAVKGALDSIVAKETWSAQDHKDLLKELYESRDAIRRFRVIVHDMESQNPDPKGAVALKIGIGRYMLCRFNEALAALGAATDNKDRRYFQAMSYKNLRQYEKAMEELDKAKDRGWDATEIDLQAVEIRALMGKLDEANKGLGKLDRLSETARYQYLRGLIDDLTGFHDKAVDSYTKAHSLDPNLTEATFRLAYYYDLHGEEEQAIQLYRTCLNRPPVHANALLNLSILYEDMGRYEQSLNCLRRLLATNPNHPRARLFLKDAEASKTMYYDEDQAKRVARRNAVLDIPVTDFELSVRARNCLKKMNVRTLGDLVRTTEADLLGYKNFGETSLKEIKDMLNIKGLRLGQAVEDSLDALLGGSGALTEIPMLDPDEVERDEEAPAAEGVMATPISQVPFSIRARKALENLNITTMGELSNRSEADLMACKNFGQTSLNEIVQRLGEYGMHLRED